MDWLFDPAIWIAFSTLTILEIVLGIDNIIFISILSGKLPPEQRNKARVIGLMLATISRVLMLLMLTWLKHLSAPLFAFDIFGFKQEITARDLVMILGGLFLVAKSTHEIHAKLEGGEEHEVVGKRPSFRSVIFQILLIDIVFSLDSVITAIGMADHVGVMIAAVIAAIGVMLIAAPAISRFVERHPTVKMLALSFLLLIGVMLIADGFEQHVSKGYIYFAMGFSVFVEMLNQRLAKAGTKPVKLHSKMDDGSTTPTSA
jgi:predicted tellurium resistance membrane protein TerC